ncbi:FtsX-like permease family protein [Pseudoduganella sp. GCM10020061]|uniref:FtsX-like permease family protein n=1 Tax=Pseudoduganella sp. GCM10020061 TaxID=3317345 RepID=UPI00363E6E7B
MPRLTLLWRWMLAGEWRAQPMRALVAVAAIAVGVAMGFAIHLINAAALNEFSAAARSLSGEADLRVEGREGVFDEAIYPDLAQREGVAAASPVLEVAAALPGQQAPLRIIGIDAMRATAVSPGLVGVPAKGAMLDTMADDTLFLSQAASNRLGVKAGSSLAVLSGTREVVLRVAGTVPGARTGQRLGVMDIAGVQWRFDRLGKLSRIDLKLAPGIDTARFMASLSADLERRAPGRFVVTDAALTQESRVGTMSRAYRVNLTVLALVALFTGAFLVFSTQALSVIRRRSQFALLRVLGLERRALLAQVLAEGAALGMIGSALGIAGGYGLAYAVLHLFGGDLGGGYFPGVQPQVHFAPAAALGYFILGTLVALAGCAAPALEASRAAPAVALKSGAGDAALNRLSRAWPGLLLLAAGALLTQAPPVGGLPLFAYIAIALMLVGAIALMPRIAAVLFRLLSRTKPGGAVGGLALARLANASGQASIALGGVLASFSLMVAMAIMVSSFRDSVDAWLVQVLPADVYIRSASGGATAALGPAEQQAIASIPGVERVNFLRMRQLSLDPARPPVALLARPIDPGKPGDIMPLTGAALPVPAGAMPAWVSEAMLDLYGTAPGQWLELPVGGGMRRFFVAGVWRDYARQFGAVQIRAEDYQALTGDRDATDAAVWLREGAAAGTVMGQVRDLPFGKQLELTEPGEIRAMSLAIFDRSFAVTYLLEAVAIAIGMSGVAATFSAQTLARAREFGMLRHVGLTRGQVLGILAAEGLLLAVLGVACGFALGFAISLVLVFVVNPQSFHWTMELHLPWMLLAAVAAALVVASVATALVSGRFALSGGPLRAVREDW